MKEYTPIPHPELYETTISGQINELSKWPDVSYLTVLAVFPLQSKDNIDNDSSLNGTMVEDLLRQKNSMKQMTSKKIHGLLTSFVRHIKLAMDVPVDSRPSIWYEVNCLMLRDMARSVIPAVLGKDVYEEHSLLIHELLNLGPVKRHYLTVCSRQIGKSKTALKVLVAAILSFTSNAEIDLYAQSANARMNNARFFIQTIDDIMKNDPEVRKMFRHVRGTVSNDTVIEYYNAKYDCTLLLRIRTGTGEEMRGVFARLSFGDEFAFWAEDVLRHIQVLRATRTDAHVIMATTYGSNTMAGRFASDAVRDPGKYFENGVVFENSFICDDCKILPDQTKCEHMIGSFPMWRDVRAAMADIQNAAGDPIKLDIARRELLGIESSGTNFCISDSTLRSVFEAPLHEISPSFRPSPPVLWFSMDPSTGRDTSSFAAIFAVCGAEGQRFILGGESFITANVHHDEVHQVIIDCMQKIFDTYPDMLKGCGVSWMYEANNNTSAASNFANTMKIYCDARNIAVDTASIYGDLSALARGITEKMLVDVEGVFWTRLENKMSGLNYWYEAANHGGIRFASKFCTSGTKSFIKVPEAGNETNKRSRRAEGMLKTYRIERDMCSSEIATKRFISMCETQMRQLAIMPNGHISGKGPKSSTKPQLHDDIAIAFLILSEGMKKLTEARSRM